MATQAGTLTLEFARRLSSAAKVNASGLVLTAAGMLLQIATGSTLYPSLTGPIVLLATAGVVTLRPGRWTPWAALLVPLVLGVGAIIAGLMSGGFVEQLTGIDRPGLPLGSVMHVVGLVAAVAGGGAMVLGRGAAKSA